MRVLVCGSRDWTEHYPIKAALERLPPDATVIHGDARGADRTAGLIATELGLAVEVYPADWNKDGIRAGPIRNQRMLDEGTPDLVLAFPLPQSKGTYDMIQRARKAGVKVIVAKA